MFVNQKVQARCLSCGHNWEVERGAELHCDYCEAKREIDWNELPLWSNYVELEEPDGPRWFR